MRTTGNDSEARKTIPITRRTGAEKRVAMSMSARRLPDLRLGDRLELTSELQVTDDCFRPNPRCAGRPYRFDPIVGSKLLLATNADVTGGRRAVAVSARQHLRCLQQRPNREHHCVVVFTHASLDVTDPNVLPCPLDACHLNLVVDAHNKRARSGDVLVIGGQHADGRIAPDRSRLNAIRLRPGSQPGPSPHKTRERVTRRIPLLGHSRVVVFSKRLRHLEKGEQLEVSAKATTDISSLTYSARISSVLLLTRGRRDTHAGGLVRRIATLKGEISEQNLFNCTQVRTPCTTRKVGVLRMKADARGRSGARVPLYANLVVSISPKLATAQSGDAVHVLKRGGLKVIRYPPAMRG